MTALMVSGDLRKWVYNGSLWDPSICWCPECPDMFRWGEYWYFVYSTDLETGGMRTYYRMSGSPGGPWSDLDNNVFDSRHFYAGKTASDGVNRYIFGWNPTKEGNTDAGACQWGGSLVVHKLVQRQDGSLATAVPDNIGNRFPVDMPICPAEGGGGFSNGPCSITCETGFSAKLLKNLPKTFKLSFTVDIKDGTAAAGIMLRSDISMEKAYALRLDKHDMLFYPAGRHQGRPETYRRIPGGRAGRHYVTVFADDTVFLAYLDDRLALSARMYDNKGPYAALFVQDGEAVFSDLKISLPG